jgi:hypothetical protein
LGLLPTILKPREVAEPKPLPDHTHPSIAAEIVELQTAVESLRRVVKQFDRDMTDAIEGIYRRRQSDRMREIRDEEDSKKPKVRTWKDLLNSPVLREKDTTEE